ncbi:hypothetical protein U1872_06430 [Sphingomonas sp. RB3P16]|uniref:hypothetical protein n=1 Tax=Parasphingomonas frigoris TaxID=3096163 RepID=UPI002FCBA558
MTDEQRAAEVVRIAAIFANGCGNTIVPPTGPETCEEFRTDFLRRMSNLMLGLAHDAAADTLERAVVEYADLKPDGPEATRIGVRNLPDWAQPLYERGRL